MAFNLVMGGLITNTIGAMVNLNVFDAIVPEGSTAAQLAEACDAKPDSLYRCLRMLSTVGVVTELVTARHTCVWMQGKY